MGKGGLVDKIRVGVLAVGLLAPYVQAEESVDKKKPEKPKPAEVFVPPTSLPQKAWASPYRTRTEIVKEKNFYGKLDEYLDRIYQKERIYRATQGKGGQGTGLERRKQEKSIASLVYFDKEPLENVINWFRHETGVNFVVNWNELEWYEIYKETPVDLELRNISLGKAFDFTLSSLGSFVKLDYTILGNVVNVSTREQLSRQMFTEVYYVADLLMPITSRRGDTGFNTGRRDSRTIDRRNKQGSRERGRDSGRRNSGNRGNDRNRRDSRNRDNRSRDRGQGGSRGSSNQFQTSKEREAGLIDMIRAIEPDSWRVNEGKGTMSILRGKLIVTNNYFVHRALGPSTRVSTLVR